MKQFRIFNKIFNENNKRCPFTIVFSLMEALTVIFQKNSSFYTSSKQTNISSLKYFLLVLVQQQLIPQLKKITKSLLLIPYLFHERKYSFSHNTGTIFHEVPCLIWHQDNTWHLIQKYQNLPHENGMHKSYISHSYFI